MIREICVILQVSRVLLGIKCLSTLFTLSLSIELRRYKVSLIRCFNSRFGFE